MFDSMEILDEECDSVEMGMNAMGKLNAEQTLQVMCLGTQLLLGACSQPQAPVEMGPPNLER